MSGRPTLEVDGWEMFGVSPDGRRVPVWWDYETYHGELVSLSGPVSPAAPLVVRGREPELSLACYVLRRDGHTRVTAEPVKEVGS